MPEDEERAAIAEAIALHTEVTGDAPRGWYTGRCSNNTVRLAAETLGFIAASLVARGALLRCVVRLSI